MGLKVAPISGIPPTLDKILWPSTWDGWIEKIAMLSLTIFLMLKQMDYYYDRLNWSRKSGLFRSLGWANTLEVVLDVLLAIWGVSLFVIAGLWPYRWLPSFTLYCLIAWARCRLTLLRFKIARRGTNKQVYHSIITKKAIECSDF